jgi:hypothetical protein
MRRKRPKRNRWLAVGKADPEKLLNVRRAVAEGVSAIAFPKPEKRRRPFRGSVTIVLK